MKIKYKENRKSSGDEYLHQHLEAEFEIDEGSSFNQAFNKLKWQVREALYPGFVSWLERARLIKGNRNKCKEELFESYRDRLDEYEDFADYEEWEQPF